MQYIVLNADSIGEITRIVNDYLAHGWAPVGGISVLQLSPMGNLSFFQAMTRDSPPDQT